MIFSVTLENWSKELTNSELATQVLFKLKSGHFIPIWRDRCLNGEHAILHTRVHVHILTYIHTGIMYTHIILCTSYIKDIHDSTSVLFTKR